MHQVVFTYVLIVGRLDVDGQSLAPIDLHKKDAPCDWFLIKWHCIGIIEEGRAASKSPH